MIRPSLTHGYGEFEFLKGKRLDGMEVTHPVETLVLVNSPDTLHLAEDLSRLIAFAVSVVPARTVPQHPLSVAQYVSNPS